MLLSSIVLTNFNNFNLSKELSSAIAEMGFVSPSEIQAKTIPLLLDGLDVIGQAQTGTGKTAAFAIPCVERLDKASEATQALILCPTRELVVQVASELTKLSKYHKNISVLAVYGGQNISIQLKALKKGAQIVVGTPGRLIDHIERGTLKLDQVNYLVLDEADQMIDMGFHDDMKMIIAETPEDRQTIMFSATMPKELIALMQKFQNDPQHISTIDKNEQSKQINQLYFHINKAHKLEALKRLLSFHKIKSALIFCNTKMQVDQLAADLSNEQYYTASLHSDLDQKKRDKVMQGFRQGSVELLIATDIAARGLDVNNLEAVINYDLPRFDQDYVHRIGRTGRAGKEGLALTLVVDREIEHIQRIARKNKLTIKSASIPALGDFEKVNFETTKNLIQNTEFNRKELSKYLEYLDQLELYSYNDEEITALLLKTLIDQERNSFKDNINFEPKAFNKIQSKSKDHKFKKKNKFSKSGFSNFNKKSKKKFSAHR